MHAPYIPGCLFGLETQLGIFGKRFDAEIRMQYLNI